MFKGRNLLIATKHEKEKVIAPILEKELGVKCVVSSNFDTDILGTFSGEIERKEDPITTARNKCILAMEISNYDLVVASEGSFGPHPNIPFIAADDEFLLFIDKKNNLEIIVRELSTETNFNAAEIRSEEELKQFINTANFPSHALILRKSNNDFTEIIKGITDNELLNNRFHYFISKYKTAYIETDMRAMYNPTRMKVIEQATQKLVKKLNSCCPTCNTPGFDISDSKKGLLCELCNNPTRSTLSYFYICKKCNYTKEEMYPHGKLKEDPMYCDICNP